jgi:predicted metalloprotease with PDZ domain
MRRDRGHWTMLCLAVVLCLGIRVAQGQSQQPFTASSPIILSVDAREAPRGILHAQLRFPVQSGPLTLFYPKWIPGEHGPTGPISDLVGIRFRIGGKEIPWRRDPLEMYEFHCDIPQGGRALEVSLDFVAPLDVSGFTSGASTTPSLAVISWNQLLLYPQGKTAAAWTYAASLTLPDGWKFGTALPVARESDPRVEFRPVSLETLVDSPVVAGQYFRAVSLGESGGRSHEVDMVADDDAELEMSPEVEGGLRRMVKEVGDLFGARHYTQYHFLLTLSDHVSHFGLEHHESSDDRVEADALTGPGARRTIGGLLGHEYVHSWNGKYRRPAGLATPDFEQPMDTDLLWVYEGLTQYLGMVLPTRSGLWTPEDFRGELARIAATLDHRSGRTWRPLEDTAVSAQILYGAPQAWSDWRRSTDFYDESALIWLEVDVMLRQKSKGRYSLDDFCRRFYGGASGAPVVVPYSVQDVEAALSELVPYDWKSFFNERLTSTAPHAPLGGIEGSGWHLAYRDTSAEPPRTGGGAAARRIDLRYSLGMSLREEGQIGDVSPDGPAGQAGLAPEMKIIAVNGRKYSPALMRQAIKEAEDSPNVIELLVEDREFYRTYRIDYHGGERYPYLERDDSSPDLLEEIIHPLSK